MKQYCVYMVTNTSNRTLYIGVTSNLLRRVGEHRLKQVKGFTSRYNLGKLVYYDVFSEVDAAIAREKQLKRWRRAKKDELIEEMNPEWRDLYPNLLP